MYVLPLKKTPEGKPAPGTKWRAFVPRKGYTTSTKVCRTKKEAEDWGKHEENRQQHSYDLSTVELRKTSVKVLLEWHRDHITPLRKTWKNETNRLNRLLREPWIHLNLSEIAAVEKAITAWAKVRKDSGIKGQSVNRDLNCLSGVFSKAREELKIKVPNPIHDIPRFPEEDVREAKVWSTDDLQLFLRAVNFDAAFHPHETRHFMPWALLLLNTTGLRPKTLFSTRLEWIDLEHRVIHYPAGAVKAGKPYDCPVDSEALPWLQKLAAHMRAARQTKLFPPSYDCVAAFFSDVRARLAVDHPHVAGLIIYGQRHTWTTVNVPLFQNVMEMMAYSGRSSVKDAMRYFSPEAKAQAETLDERRRERDAAKIVPSPVAAPAPDMQAIIEAATKAAYAAALASTRAA